MLHLAESEGVAERVVIDSAGTGGWHEGEPADPRARAAARRHGVVITSIARQFASRDFEMFDLVLAMDLENLVDLASLAESEDHRQKVRLLREFDPEAGDDLEVPDPYYGYGEEDGFDAVFDMCRRACRGLLDEVKQIIANADEA